MPMYAHSPLASFSLATGNGAKALHENKSATIRRLRPSLDKRYSQNARSTTGYWRPSRPRADPTTEHQNSRNDLDQFPPAKVSRSLHCIKPRSRLSDVPYSVLMYLRPKA
ncbi:hypothetical protein K461DRAFT_176521 [Myriangium duriaei CBS 260.36]|uniref:Uncharacterized protein n=1 Tax=Myriangium duriaei CBS 260.36 TaxID=1168546 RepID=A0A9P4IUZ3_9PEZI|nr:hypothetical protein K461DRAFT_176521 [Myriangium duriaei CBS 260.36]